MRLKSSKFYNEYLKGFPTGILYDINGKDIIVPSAGITEEGYAAKGLLSVSSSDSLFVPVYISQDTLELFGINDKDSWLPYFSTNVYNTEGGGKFYSVIYDECFRVDNYAILIYLTMASRYPHIGIVPVKEISDAFKSVKNKKKR